MKILVTVLLTALFVFALATTWVDIVQPQLRQNGRTAPEATARASEAPVPKKRTRKVSPPPVAPAELPDDEESTVEPPPVTSRQSRESSAALARKMDEVKQQESSLVARQEALRMIYDDIRTELATVDEIRRQTTADLAEAERRVRSTAQRRPAPAPKSARAPVPPSRVAAGTPASRAEAQIIRQLVDQGKLETAVSLLKSMKGRDAASVLTVLSSQDPRLADRLADSISLERDDTVRR